MLRNMYTINYVTISDGIISTSSDVFNTKEERDAAWHRVVHDHNEMVRDCFDLDLNSNYEDEYYYEWNDNELEFYDKADPDMHRDYYIKDYCEVEVDDKVFVVLIDSYDGEGASIVETEIFNTLDAAKEHLAILKKDFKDNVPNWNDTDLYTIEEDDEFFTWYETGCYDKNHYCLDIYQRSVHSGTIVIGKEDK